jgi:hypothetical protein
VVCIVPAAQLPCGKQLDWLALPEYSPLGQSWQTRSIVADGVLLTNVPGWQLDQGAQVDSLAAVLNEPLAHGRHTLSLVAVPSDDTNMPARQEVWLTHGVAGLRSLSHVPAAQTTGVAVSPAQYWPAGHAMHTTGEVEVPDAICSVPAAQVAWAWHEVWLLLAEYSPAGQAAHTRSIVVDGVLVT